MDFFMKKIIYIVIILFLQTAHAQQNFCADSSIRIKYMFSNTGAEFKSTLADTAGFNFFIGDYINRTTSRWDAALMKINFGDSIIWAKKLHNNNSDFKFYNSVPTPGNTKIFTGVTNNGGIGGLLVTRIDDDGNVLWLKNYKTNFGVNVGAGGGGENNVLITNTAVYICGYLQSNSFDWGFILKLDLNGNILWSRVVGVNLAKYVNIASGPVLKNGILYIAGGYSTTLPNGSVEAYPIIIQLNDTDGSHLKSTALRVSPNPIVREIAPKVLAASYNNTFSLSGPILTNNGSNALGAIFSASFDSLINPVTIRAYRYNISLNSYDLRYEFNHRFQHAILGYDAFTFNNKYFLTFERDNSILRSRKFFLPGNFNFLYNNTVNFDDKQNLHFLYQYPTGSVGSPLINEYARISNFAPNGTVGCFGKDTSFFTPFTFNITTQPFTWDVLNSDVLVASDIPYTLDTAVVSKQVVCKIVSYCDTVKISGPAAVCVGVPVRYTIRRNNTCLKYTEWSVDTAFATIINLEGDSAININFKKAFNGRIYAALTDCVVKDSFLVKAVVPKMPPLIKRTDSLLCPGKTLTLSANNGYSNYVWQGSVAAQQFTVNAIGVYTVTALDSCGITKTDSIRVILSDTSLTIPPTQTICLYDTAFITLPADVNNITWQPTTNSFLNNKTLLFYPPQTTLYTITAERTPNCSILKTSTVVIKTCPQTVFIPNSFTPNNDSKNDIFKPAISQPLALYRLQIFNRYGQTIFESNNQQSGWDGTYKGSRQPMGGYIYQCSYKFNGGLQKMVKGYFILIR